MAQASVIDGWLWKRSKGVAASNISKLSSFAVRQLSKQQKQRVNILKTPVFPTA
jgi:hypothetical protein